MAPAINDLTVTSEAARIRLLNRHIGCTVEMLAGPDDLTADDGRFLFIRAADGIEEPCAVVEFERNGRWAIPVSMLHVPGVDHMVQETSAFLLAGRHAPERRLMFVSFELVRSPSNEGESSDGTHNLECT